jgi:hypothetical protein
LSRVTTTVGPPDGRDAAAGAHGDALGLERGADLVAGERFLTREQPGLALDDGHLGGTEPAEPLGELGTYRPAAEHHQPARNEGRPGGAPVVPRLHVGEARNRRHERLRPGRQHYRLAGREPPDRPGRRVLVRLDRVGGVDVDPQRAGQPAAAAHQRDPAVEQPWHRALVRVATDHLVPPGERGRGVDLAGHRARGAGHPARRRDHVSRP